MTPKGFNSISEITVKSYINRQNKNWCDLLKEHDKFDELVKYIVEEYLVFIEKHKKVNLHLFTKIHEYITYDLLLLIGVDTIKNNANVVKKRYTKDDYRNNIFDVIEHFGKIPMYPDFEKYSKISINSYAIHLKLKGSVYANIFEYYVKDKNLIDNYYKDHKEYKSKLGKETGILSYNPISNEELDKDFKEKFDLFLHTYGVNPPRRTFEKLLKYSLEVYKKRYKLSWKQICKKYGYEVTDEANRSEKIALTNVSKILNEEYLPQKTWKWLIGVGGKNMYCDGYFPNHNLVIEFDGAQHRKSLEVFGGYEKFLRRQENDALKEKLLHENGIQLIRIPSNKKFYDLNYIKKLLKEEGVIG